MDSIKEYLPSEMAEALRKIIKLDQIGFGNKPNGEVYDVAPNPGLTDPKYYEDIAEAINELKAGLDIRDFDIFIEKKITRNGEYLAFDDDAYGYSLVDVEVDGGDGIGGTTKTLVERNIRSIEMPDVGVVGAYAFANCVLLSSVSFPSCTQINTAAFLGCTHLPAASFPLCETVGASAFTNCQSLARIDLPACTNIGNNAFIGCSELSEIYLLGSLFCSINSTATYLFTGNTLFNNYRGSIFVPASLYSMYITDSYWTAVSSAFVSVGSYTPPAIHAYMHGTCLALDGECATLSGSSLFLSGANVNMSGTELSIGGVE